MIGGAERERRLGSCDLRALARDVEMAFDTQLTTCDRRYAVACAPSEEVDGGREAEPSNDRRRGARAAPGQL